MCVAKVMHFAETTKEKRAILLFIKKKLQ